MLLGGNADIVLHAKVHTNTESCANLTDKSAFITVGEIQERRTVKLFLYSVDRIKIRHKLVFCSCKVNYLYNVCSPSLLLEGNFQSFFFIKEVVNVSGDKNLSPPYRESF